MKGLTRKEIEAIANSFSKHLKLSVPVGLEQAAKAINARIIYSEMPDIYSGMLIAPYLDIEEYIISVNANHHHKRQRYTIAHEIGHIVLEHSKQYHSKPSSFLYLLTNKEPTTFIERQANLFAAELLMPRKHLIETIRDFSKKTTNLSAGEIEILSGFYKVSKEALRIRLSEVAYYLQ